MAESIEDRLCRKLPPVTRSIWQHPIRNGVILFCLWVSTYGFTYAVSHTGNRDYFLGSAISAALVITGHIVVHLAHKRIRRVLDGLLVTIMAEHNAEPPSIITPESTE